jgi:hypothetical protein
MPVVNHMVAHPVRECHMVTDEPRIISSFPQPGGLCFFSCIKEANIETIQTVRRRRRPDLPGRDRIAAQQKVLPLTLSIKSAPYRPLHHSMSPFDLPFRSASEHTQFGYFENVSEFRLDQLADCGLTHPASACYQKKHMSSLQFQIELITLTTEVSDAGGPARPHWQLTWSARVRSSDFVGPFRLSVHCVRGKV